MSERKYSVAEIDRMRRATRNIYDLTRMGVPMRSEEIAVETEERLRTYMLNGTDPEELEAHAAESLKQYMAAQKNFARPR